MCTIGEKEYLAFAGSDRKSIYVYDLITGTLVKRIDYQLEGDGAIGKIGAFFIQDFNNIFIATPFQTVVYRADSAGHVLQRIHYDHTTGLNPVELESMATTMGDLVVTGHQLHLPVELNGAYGTELIEKSKVGIVIDTLNHTVKELPLGFPPLITYGDIGSGTGAGSGCFYNRCFDGESFIYSFYYNDLMYKASANHQTVLRKKVKSRYATDVDVLRIKASGFQAYLKEEAEHSSYKDCLYDPYRKVYYRFAYPASELDTGDSYLEILRNGKKQVSIMILDKDLEILGETLLPEFTYSSNAHFVGKDGLYLSVSHFKRDDYSEDTLRFQRLELVYN
ncbi:DUF4221 family protein [Parabacteroides sp.]